MEELWRSATDIGIGITDVLTLIDRALQQAESRAGMSPDDMVRFRSLLERALYEVLLHDNDRGKQEQQKRLDVFTSWLFSLDHSVGLITTNYDISVESRLFPAVGNSTKKTLSQNIGNRVDFGFAWRNVDTGEIVMRPANPSWRLYKMHGSVNWLKCGLCGQIYLNPHGAVASKAFSLEINEWNTCHCNDWSRLCLHLVTPSFIRQTNDSHLLGIWQAALEYLRTADRWIIIGYSLPTDDISIRSLLLRAWDARNVKPRITVVQRANAATEKTFRTFFPASSLTYFDKGLEAYLAEQHLPPARTKLKRKVRIRTTRHPEEEEEEDGEQETSDP